MTEPLSTIIPHPFILSLQLDDSSFAILDGLRRRHFPPERNVIAAHVTLFHALPGGVASETVIREQLDAVCATTDAFDFAMPGLRSLGRGVAVEIQSVTLLHFRSRLASAFAEWLTPQDRQQFQPHVTIQNKVTPEAAKELLRTLSAEWLPMVARATGVHLWRYEGGPWERVGTFRFAESPGNRSGPAV